MLPETPYLLVDDDVLRRNVHDLADRAAELGLQVRPHAKTHKCAQVAELQIASGATGLSVATIGEAEAFAAAGFTDLFIAYPLWLTDAKAARLRALAESVPTRLRVAIDSADGARQLARGLGGAPADVLVEIDSGMHRSGIAPHRAGDVAAVARDAGLSVIGVFTFPGHGYDPGDAREQAAREESAALAEAAQQLRAHGIEPAVISGGSTPTAEFADPGVLTEIRPGVYPFNDAQQWELGSCTHDQIALVAMATVVSIPEPVDGRPRVILDAGSKTLGADRPAWVTGFGRLLDYPHARIVAQSEHHATVEFPDPEFPDPAFPGAESPARATSPAPPSLGDQVRVVPNHVCTAVNLADELIVETPSGLQSWPVIARGANS